jgi:hypothetical protein
VCYNVADNYLHVVMNGPMFATPRTPNMGHGNAAAAYMPGRNAMLYYSGDGSGANVKHKFFAHYWLMDFAGLAGQDWRLNGAPWNSSATTPAGSSAYDETNDKVIIWPAYLTNGSVVTAVVDPVTRSITTYTAAQTVTQPTVHGNMELAYRSVDGRIYEFGGGTNALYRWDTPTHTWALMSPSGTPPGARQMAGFAYSIDDDKFLIAGGGSGSTWYTDTWVYDPVANSYTQLSPTANYSQGSQGAAVFQKLAYDKDSHVFVMWTTGGNLPYLYALSTATPLNYGRTSNTYTPTAGSLNRFTPSSSDQSWAYSPTIASVGSSIMRGWIESFGDTDTTSCANGEFHPFVQLSTDNGSTWNNLPSGSQATACTALDSEASSNTRSARVNVALIGGSQTPYVAWDKFGGVAPSVYVKSWTGSAWSGGQLGCFLRSPCVDGDNQYMAGQNALIDNNGTPTVAVIEWNSSGEDSYAYVAQKPGGSWTLMDKKLNVYTTYGSRILAAALASDGTNPAACWAEEFRDTSGRPAGVINKPQIFCAKWNGTSWDRSFFGTSALSASTNWASDPAMTYAGGKFYIAWTDRTDSGTEQVRMCRWDGSSCTQIGSSSLNVNTATGWSTRVSLNTDGTNVYLSWVEQTALGQHAQGHVMKWNGSTLSAMGNSVAADPSNGSLEDLAMAYNNGAPVVLYSEIKFGSLRQVYSQSQANSNPPGCLITTSSLPNVSIGQVYNQTIATAGCASPTFSVTSGSISPFILNTSTGAITGYSGTAGAVSFTIGVTAANGTGSQALSFTVTNPSVPTTTNTITVTNAGTTVTNYPLQFGRGFTQGEIPTGQLPQAWVGTTAVPTQVDVKQRWSDSSLKQAVISIMIPTFTASTSYTITLGPGNTVGNTALTQAQMLDPSYNFDATISLTNGTTKSASARTMLTNNDYTAWTSGPIATTVILANDANAFACSGGNPSGAGSTTSTYDFGFNGFCGFRPRFQATFWQTTHQVFVRYVGEVANTQQAGDVSGITAVTLTSGSSSPATVYTLPSGKSPLNMRAWTRWTKTAWIGGTPPNASINHNLAYLAASNFIPNFNGSLTIPGTQVTNAYATFTKLDTADPYSPADYTLNQSATGARNYPAMEVAPISGPVVTWIYTGDYRTEIMARRYYELGAGWPVHFREGASGKWFDRAHTVDAKGHWVSASARPSLYILDTQNSNTATGDRIVPVATIGSNPWFAESAHLPDWAITYALTGDYFFLEENTAWATWGVTQVAGYRTNDPCGRGPTGVEGNIPSDYGGICGQPRAQAWTLRQRADAAFYTPDSMAEQDYLNQEVIDSIAAMDAIHEVTGVYSARAIWTWAHKWGNADCSNGRWTWCNSAQNLNLTVPTAIHHWGPDNNQFDDYPEMSVVGSTTGAATSLVITISAMNMTSVDYNQIFCSSSGGSFSPSGFTTSGSDPVTSVTVNFSSQTNPSCTIWRPLTSQAPWQVNWIIYALGRAREYGYGTSGLLEWVGPWLISQLTDVNYNPWLVGAYRMPAVKTPSTWFATWADMKASFCSSQATGCNNLGTSTNAQTATTFDPPINRYSTGCALSPMGDGACGAPFFAGMAMSYLTSLTNGAAAWNWINANAMSDVSLNNNPMWAISARATGGAPTAPQITTTSPLTTGTVTGSYSTSIQATGGTPPYAFAVSTGSLPAGLTLAGSGLLSGTPTAPVSASFSIIATDSLAAPSSAAAFAMSVVAAPVITTSSLPSATVGTPYSQAILVTGGAPPLLFTLASGSLPAGLSLSSTGTISGTPVAEGSSLFTVTASDLNSVQNTSGSLSISVLPLPPQPEEQIKQTITITGTTTFTGQVSMK